MVSPSGWGQAGAAVTVQPRMLRAPDPLRQRGLAEWFPPRESIIARDEAARGAEMRAARRVTPRPYDSSPSFGASPRTMVGG